MCANCVIGLSLITILEYRSTIYGRHVVLAIGPLVFSCRLVTSELVLADKEVSVE